MFNFTNLSSILLCFSIISLHISRILFKSGFPFSGLTLLFNLFICLFSLQYVFCQENNQENNQEYKEDQFYFGVSYFLQAKEITDFKQNGFSGNFQVGFIRDISLDKKNQKALGIGVGFERNKFTSNIQPFLNSDDQVDYRLVVSRFLESKNELNYSSIVFPIELRWRTSSPNKYDFWRIYGGLKIKRNYYIYSNPSYGRSLTIKKRKEWTNSIYLNSGFNTWNIHLEYDLNSVFENKKTDIGEEIDINFFKIGLIFYIL